MEGTRHEKAGLVVASYAIGFVTAFILYSNITNKSEDVILSIPDTSSAAAVIAAAAPTSAPEAASGVVLSYVDGVLQATIGESVHTLSFNPEISDLKSDVTELTQGYHYGEMAYGLSLDNKFAFFCERHDGAAASCAGYVYDIAADRIYPVVKNGEVVTISEKSAVEAVWTNIGLAIGSSYSANASAPWVLIDKESALDLQ
jgi:hypothetical protein